jgi:hypothetical protein
MKHMVDLTNESACSFGIYHGYSTLMRLNHKPKKPPPKAGRGASKPHLGFGSDHVLPPAIEDLQFAQMSYLCQ